MEFSSGFDASGGERRLCVYLDASAVGAAGFGSLAELLAEALERDGFQVFGGGREGAGLSAAPLDPVLAAGREFNWMQTCDAFVAVLPRDAAGRLVRAEGVHTRLGWAGALRKRVVVAGDGLPGPDAPALLRGLSALTRVEFLPLAEVRSRPRQLAWQVRAVLAPGGRGGYAPYSAASEQAMLGCVS